MNAGHFSEDPRRCGVVPSPRNPVAPRIGIKDGRARRTLAAAYNRAKAEQYQRRAEHIEQILKGIVPFPGRAA